MRFAQFFALVAMIACGANSQAYDVRASSDQPKGAGKGEIKIEHAPKADHGEAKGGVDPFGWHVDTALFAFVVFGGLILVLRRFAWKPILAALDDRERSIQKAADDAAQAKAEAASLRAELKAKLDQAGDQVRQMIDEARRDGQNLREEMLSKAREEISAERERVFRALETAKDQALQEISLRSIKLASMLTSKVLGRDIAEADHSRLLDEAIVDLDKSMATTGAR